jgi:hypothetical protein
VIQCHFRKTARVLQAPYRIYQQFNFRLHFSVARKLEFPKGVSLEEQNVNQQKWGSDRVSTDTLLEDERERLMISLGYMPRRYVAAAFTTPSPRRRARFAPP